MNLTAENFNCDFAINETSTRKLVEVFLFWKVEKMYAG